MGEGGASVRIGAFIREERLKAMLHEAIFLATFCCETSCKKDFTCNNVNPVLQPATATKCCVASCKKSRNIPCVTSDVHRNLQGNFVKIRQSRHVFCSQEISSWRRKSCTAVNDFHRGVASCEKILRTCDTSSATCNVYQSSSLRDKLQEKLPRVTWPLLRGTQREKIGKRLRMQFSAFSYPFMAF